MIRNAIVAILSILTLATLVVYVLSYTVHSRLECFVSGEEYVRGIVTKDLALLQVLGDFSSVMVKEPRTDGLLIRLWKLEDGSRAYLRSHRGSIEFIGLHLIWPPSLLVPKKKGWAGFKFLEHATTGPSISGGHYDEMSPEGQQWCKECFCKAGTTTVPLWALFLVFGAYPFAVLVIAPIRRHRRRIRNECVYCGYNLTGLPEPRCPECGARS